MKKPELLSPAGNLERMRMAFAYGADAVYAGQPRYSLRARNNSFNHENLILGINEAHANNKLFFVASNIIATNKKVDTYLKDLEPVIEAKPDALIMTDPGLIKLVKERWPDIEVHLSVQSSVMNFAAVKFWQSVGISRVILSRELSLKDIAEIRERCPDIELETFVHGALCMAYSGRCLLSGYFNHRDPNQGACTNSCRWKYELHDAKSDEWGNLERQDSRLEKQYIVAEQGRRSEEYNAIEEDEHGTYIFNSKDLRAIQHVGALIEMGIDCLKIEGRTKSAFYAARTAQLYRKAIDDALAGRPFDFQLMDDLEGLSSRGYTEGFYRRHVPEEYQTYENRNQFGSRQQVVGQLIDYDNASGWLTVAVKNQFSIGDRLEIMTPSGNIHQPLKAMQDEKGHTLARAAGSGHVVKIHTDTPLQAIKNGFLIRHWQDKV